MRIYLDARANKRTSLNNYLDELLTEAELLDKSSERLAAYFDGLIEGGDATEH